MDNKVLDYFADDGNVEVIDFDEANSTVQVSVITSMISQGQAVIPGGTKGQVYTKKSDEDFDVAWEDNLSEGVEGIKGDAEDEYSQGFYNITPAKIGLGNVDNTSDVDKPISKAQEEVNTKFKQDFDSFKDSMSQDFGVFKQEVETTLKDQGEKISQESQNREAADTQISQDLSTHTTNFNNPHSVTKEQVGLGNVTNDAQVKRSEMGVANGVATLDENAKVITSQLPDFILGQIVYGGNAKGSPITYTPDNPVTNGEHIHTMYFNRDVIPDFSQVDWTQAESSEGMYIINILNATDGPCIVKVLKGTEITENHILESDGYFITCAGEGPVYATENLSVLLSGEFGWLMDSQSFEGDSYIVADAIKQQDVWGGWMSKDGKWTRHQSEVTALLTTSAQSKLNTTLDSLVLSNDDASLTGYTSNYGLYYTCVSSFEFANIDFNIGDWLISNGRAWTKVDNTDAVSGVKGQAETKYRTGPVNITQRNLGFYRYEDTWVTFSKDATQLDNDYPYVAMAAFEGLVDTSQIADVYFSADDVKSGKFAPYCETVYQSAQPAGAINPIAVGDTLESTQPGSDSGHPRLYINSAITPDFTEFDQEKLSSTDGYALISVKENDDTNTPFLIAMKQAINNSDGVSGVAYAIFMGETVLYAESPTLSPSVVKLTNWGWQQSTNPVENTKWSGDAVVTELAQQDIWGKYISKDGQWRTEEPAGIKLRLYCKEEMSTTIPMIAIH